MKKKVLTIILTLSLIAGLAPMTQAVILTVNERGYISVNSSESKELSPDVAEISFAVKTSDTKSMQKATLANKEVSDKLYSMLNSMITKENGDYIKTSNYNATPVYTYSGNKRNLDKYEVSNRVTVHTKSIDKVGTMIDKAIEAGATNVDSLSFSVSKYDNECDVLLGVAAKKSNARASMIAKNLGTSLDGIRSVDLNCSANNNYSMPRLYMAKNMLGAVADSAAGETSSTSISSGVIKINANINVTYFVK